MIAKRTLDVVVLPCTSDATIPPSVTNCVPGVTGTKKRRGKTVDSVPPATVLLPHTEAPFRDRTTRSDRQAPWSTPSAETAAALPSRHRNGQDRAEAARSPTLWQAPRRVVPHRWSPRPPIDNARATCHLETCVHSLCVKRYRDRVPGFAGIGRISRASPCRSDQCGAFAASAGATTAADGASLASVKLCCGLPPEFSAHPDGAPFAGVTARDRLFDPIKCPDRHDVTDRRMTGQRDVERKQPMPERPKQPHRFRCRQIHR